MQTDKAQNLPWHSNCKALAMSLYPGAIRHRERIVRFIAIKAMIYIKRDAMHPRAAELLAEFTTPGCGASLADGEIKMNGKIRDFACKTNKRRVTFRLVLLEENAVISKRDFAAPRFMAATVPLAAGSAGRAIKKSRLSSPARGRRYIRLRWTWQNHIPWRPRRNQPGKRWLRRILKTRKSRSNHLSLRRIGLREQYRDGICTPTAIALFRYYRSALFLAAWKIFLAKELYTEVALIGFA